ncbi:HIT/MYND zinc finger-like protein [Glarea lozoyensis ATCC 20868]|uniref:Box C/D snoRNA protein 1 n=1 Tax=Glarea lozoyensis (strain ATCC 20868 / MF5171) TaxID=1116229 RepID=S3D0T8_GLAL2|nr:HIT/MYND zinc finger-like protein [Glarea lozoyensis ATCC 20868]EPE25646.1 HIT/MYND zinc finger-like protein [Glarea lozoyensis ATCC 20868]
MAEPLLSDLCTICHILTPKYTCPKCSTKTCSLKCSRRHKLWSSCSGVRDPTTFKPRSELLTPSGVDHDYNFLHSIEAKIERSEKEIVEDRKLVSESELREARGGVERKHKGRSSNQDRKYNLLPGEVLIDKCLRLMGIRVMRAPVGMARRRENKTNWSKPHKSINWQVEWIKEGEKEKGKEEKLMAKCMGNIPLGVMWSRTCEAVERENMGSEEKSALKKRKASDLRVRERLAKRAKIEATRQSSVPMVGIAYLQEPTTGAWNIPIPSTTARSSPDPSKVSTHTPALEEYKEDFYLQRVPTPSSFPKVLVQLDPTLHLTDQLRGRAVLEYPTIYVFAKCSSLPKGFMLEKEFLQKTGQQALDESEESSSESSDGSEDSESSEDDSEDGSEDEGSDSSDTEEGEISNG